METVLQIKILKDNINRNDINIKNLLKVYMKTNET